MLGTGENKMSVMLTKDGWVELNYWLADSHFGLQYSPGQGEAYPFSAIEIDRYMEIVQDHWETIYPKQRYDLVGFATRLAEKVGVNLRVTKQDHQRGDYEDREEGDYKWDIPSWE